MPEWQIITDSDDFPNPMPEESPHPRPHRWWWIFIGIVVVVVMLGFITLQRQLAERQVAIRNDLTAFIYEEESVRHYGDPDQATTLAIAGTPLTWLQAYRQTFQTDRSKSPPTAITLGEIDFDGQCAVVKTELDNAAQIRTYCLNDERQWRRAPLSPVTWGAKDSIDLPDDVRLEFRARDQAFAEALALDLAQFFERVTKLTSSPIEVAEIIIEPSELLPPLVYQNEQLLVVNSPDLAYLDEKHPSGQIAVRLALAEALLRQASPALNSADPLPGGDQFQRAALTVLAMHLLLPADSQEELLGAWHHQLDEQWFSPFFADALPTEFTVPPEQIELATVLTAEYIYQIAGPEALVILMQQLPTAKSWDTLFKMCSIGQLLPWKMRWLRISKRAK
jgi:hypothetical protein